MILNPIDFSVIYILPNFSLTGIWYLLNLLSNPNI
jgi:hypothetical protein